MGKLFWFVLGAVATVSAGVAAVLWEENKLTRCPYWYGSWNDRADKKSGESEAAAENSNQDRMIEPA
jgi:hypothetical protein